MEFMIVAVSEEDRNHFVLSPPRDILSSSMLGWEDTMAGVKALELLSIGETVMDEDGDTWERVS